MNTKQQNNKTYIVYKHTSPSNKVYIGITSKDVRQRWCNGFGYQTQLYFFRAIVKYGWINFKHEILYEGLNEEDAKLKEIELISKYKSTDIHYGYNIDSGGDNHLVDKETKEKIRISKKEKPWTLFQRQSIEAALDCSSGRVVLKYKDDILIDKFNNVRLAAKDANCPTETMRSKLNKKEPPIINGYKYCYEIPNKFKHTPLEDRNYVTRKVLVYDLSYKLVGEYKSINQAARELNIKSASHVASVCRGERKQTYGYIWRYKDENKDN